MKKNIPVEAHRQLSRVVTLVNGHRPIRSISINQRVHKALKKWAVGVGMEDRDWTHFINIPMSINNGVGTQNLCILRFAKNQSLAVALDNADSFEYDVNEKGTP